MINLVDFSITRRHLYRTYLSNNSFDLIIKSSVALHLMNSSFVQPDGVFKSLVRSILSGLSKSMKDIKNQAF